MEKGFLEEPNKALIIGSRSRVSRSSEKLTVVPADYETIIEKRDLRRYDIRQLSTRANSSQSPFYDVVTLPSFDENSCKAPEEKPEESSKENNLYHSLDNLDELTTSSASNENSYDSVGR